MEIFTIIALSSMALTFVGCGAVYVYFKIEEGKAVRQDRLEVHRLVNDVYVELGMLTHQNIKNVDTITDLRGHAKQIEYNSDRIRIFLQRINGSGKENGENKED
jgi:hypothetical protein